MSGNSTQIPSAIESERAVLGAILVDEKHLGAAEERSRIEDYYLSAHREIMRTSLAMRAQKKAVDIVTLTEELQRLGKLESIGGAPFLADLMIGVPDRPNIETYLRNIRDAARARELHSAASLVCTAIEQGEAVDQVLGRLQEQQESLTQAHSPQEKLFLPAPKFVAQAPQSINWLVEGVIERGANGFIAAPPKAGKSWATIDLALSLALGCDWLGFRVPEAVKVALISREDNPSLTAWRIRKLFGGKSCSTPAGLIELNLHVNSRQQTAELMLDNREQMAHLMAELRALQPYFAIFDVFNVLHAADENDNQEMRTVLRQLSLIQSKIGCGIGVVHHYNKSDQGSMTQRLRGSSAIAGWAEWLIGISMADEETRTRRMEFELKAAEPPEPIHFRIESNPEISRLERVSYDSQHRVAREGSAAARLMQ
jgi:RecA-family ATPase